MVDIQLISKVLQTSSIDILLNNEITAEYFPEYRDEVDFIFDHYEKYGNVPDKATFLNKFPDVELVDVSESDKYLIDTIREEYLYYRSVPVITKAAELLKSNSNTAAEYLINAMRYLQPEYDIGGVDIIRQARERYNQYQERKNHQEDWFFTCGFEELDELMQCIKRVEEFLVIVARTNMGKSFVLEKICTHIWEIGYNVGYISPEMSASSIGYRFDTLYKNYSNKGLMWSKNGVDDAEYEKYIEDITTRKNSFVVATPADFNRQITVTKLKNWIKKYKLDCIAIDGITYLSDERYMRGDNKTTMLTHISEDLISLSVELKVPVLVVVQANRNGVIEADKDGVPELESIRDSDGIAMNATKVLSIRQTKEGVLKIIVKKNRYGTVGGEVAYNWDIDTGSFTYLPMADDAIQSRERDTTASENKRKRGHNNASENKEDVF